MAIHHYYNLVIRELDPVNDLLDRLTIRSYLNQTEAELALRLAAQQPRCQMVELADSEGHVLVQQAGPERACLMVGR